MPQAKFKLLRPCRLAAAGLGGSEKELIRSKLLGHIGKSTIMLIEHDTEFIASLGWPILFMNQGKFLFEGTYPQVEERAKEAGVYF